MKIPALTLCLAVGAALISPAPPARAGVVSNLLGTAAEVVQPGSGGVVRSGWGLLRGVGRAVIPRRRRSRPAPAVSTPPTARPAAAKPAPSTGRRPPVEQPVQAMAADPPASTPAARRGLELTVQDLLLDPPPPPGAPLPPPASGRP